MVKRSTVQGKRSLQKGLTLIELMVVILILGLIAGVVGLAVGNAFADAKSQLDARSLTDFKSSLELGISNKRKEVRSLKETKFSDLIAELYKYRILKLDDVEKLAGASGTKGEEGDYEKGSIDTGPNGTIIFTGPANGAALLNLTGKGKKEDGVLFCYNKSNYNLYEEDGMVVLIAGKKTAEVLPFTQFELTFKDIDKAKNLKEIKSDNSGFFNKFPFENVAEE